MHSSILLHNIKKVQMNVLAILQFSVEIVKYMKALKLL